MPERIDNWWWQDFATLGSTNDKAIELSSNPPAPFFVVTAAEQTKGRGRRGREWQGYSGNLFMSLALPIATQDWGQLVFVVSLSLLETIKFFEEGAQVCLKWPNDVLLNDCKISGILLEKGSGEYIIIGIGVNLTAAPQKLEAVLYRATSLAAEGINVNRIDFLCAYLKHFTKNVSLWKTEGFVTIQQLWQHNAKGLNEEITVNMPKEQKKGIFRGIDENGLLRLEHSGMIEKISAGDVFYKE